MGVTLVFYGLFPIVDGKCPSTEISQQSTEKSIRNTEGTLNFQPRVHKFDILFTPAPSATVETPSPQNLFFYYKETIRFYGPDGTPTTGLDADATGFLTYPGFPELPVATYVGDGFGGEGPGGKRIPVDPEGIVIDSRDGSFWISDEYGPFIYHFDQVGKMVGAIRPPPAYLPMRNGMYFLIFGMS
jgi:hypothetical protein